MKDLIILSFLLLGGGCTLGAQVPVEILAGHRQLQHEFFLFKDLDTKQRASLFSMARFAVDYQDEAANSSFISSQLTYNLSSSWGLSAGANYADGDFAPIVALSYTYISPKEDLFLNIFPTFIIEEELSYELFGLLFYTPRLSEKYSLFSQLLFGVNLNRGFNQHQYSYQQMRLGVGYKDWFQVGLGLDKNWIGSGDQLLYANNFGLFIRKEL